MHKARLGDTVLFTTIGHPEGVVEIQTWPAIVTALKDDDRVDLVIFQTHHQRFFQEIGHSDDPTKTNSWRHRNIEVVKK